jgi:hypothetical protein
MAECVIEGLITKSKWERIEDCVAPESFLKAGSWDKGIEDEYVHGRLAANLGHGLPKKTDKQKPLQTP